MKIRVVIPEKKPSIKRPTTASLNKKSLINRPVVNSLNISETANNMKVELIPVEYQNQRVLTTRQLAEKYETDIKIISNNFNRNKNKYLENKHYYCLKGDDLRDFISIHHFDEYSPNTPLLYLWTVSGALFHARSLNTDVAWKVYEGLVDNYFRSTHQIPQTYAESSRLAAEQAEIIEAKDRTIAELTIRAEFFDKFVDSGTTLDMSETAKVLNMGIGRNGLFKILRDNGILMSNNQPYQKYIDQGYFRLIIEKRSNPGGNTYIYVKTQVYPRGLDFIRKLIAKRNLLIKNN
jgi:phage antirepressor YoqD-like protein